MNDDDQDHDLLKFRRWVSTTVRSAIRTTAVRLHEAADGPERRQLGALQEDIRRLHQSVQRIFGEIETRLGAVHTECRGYAVQSHVDELKQQVRAEITLRLRSESAAEARILALEQRLLKATCPQSVVDAETQRLDAITEAAKAKQDEVMRKDVK